MALRRKRPQTDKHDSLLQAINSGNLTTTMEIVMIAKTFSLSLWDDSYIYLRRAVLVKNVEIAKFLLYMQANIKLRSQRTNDLLVHAVELKDMDIIVAIALADHNKCLDINAKNICGETPLRVAVRILSYPIIHVLLHEYKPDLHDESNRSALIFAIITNTTKDSLEDRNNIAIISKLQEYGFTFKAEDARNINVLQSVLNKQLEEELEKLLILGADPNAIVRHSDGQTMLQIALEKENVKMANLLLKYGAHINHKNLKGETFLMIAISRIQEYNVVEYLLSKGIDINAEAPDGRTALHYFIDHRVPSNYVDLLKLLLEKGADPFHLDKKSQPPLYRAIMQENIEAIGTLTWHCDIVNKKFPNGQVPLQVAVCNRKTTSLVAFLIELGADVDVLDYDGRTLFHVAIIRRNEELSSCLLKYNADISIRDNDGYLAIEYLPETPEYTLLFATFYSYKVYAQRRKEFLQFTPHVLQTLQTNTYFTDVDKSLMMEVIDMRKTVIWKYVTCYDLLSWSDFYLSELTQNKQFLKSLDKFSFDRYSNYNILLKQRVRDILKWRKLLNPALTVLQHIFGVRICKSTCFEIAKYLRTKDVTRLLFACHVDKEKF